MVVTVDKVLEEVTSALDVALDVEDLFGAVPARQRCWMDRYSGYGRTRGETAQATSRDFGDEPEGRSMRRWFFVRHGQTDWNRVGRAQGQSDPPLNKEGHRQAQAVAARLKRADFVAAYTSDLGRAVDTAAPIMRGRDAPMIHRIDLREKHFGEWEGMTFDEVRRKYPRMYERLFDEKPEFAPPGGESDMALRARAVAAFARIAYRHSGTEGNVLVVSHGGTLRAMIVSMLGLPIDAMWRFRLSNAGLSIVTVFDEGSATLDLLNDTSHLGAGFDV